MSSGSVTAGFYMLPFLPTDEIRRCPPTSGPENFLLVRPDQFCTYASDFVRVHVVVLTGIGFSDISPCPGLPHRKAEFFIHGGSFGEIVHRHANVLDAFSMKLQEICINIRGGGWWLNPLITDCAHPLKADFK